MDSCSHCGSQSTLFRCGGCDVELFCGKECQRAAWRTHRPFCKGVKERRPWESVTGLACCPYCKAVPRPRGPVMPEALSLTTAFYRGTVLMDYFPGTDTERMWGIVMGTDDGQLMFECWQRLLCMGGIIQEVCGAAPTPYVCVDAIAAALSAGTLPALFERAVRGLAAYKGDQFPHFPRMVARGFVEIPWDAELHRGFARAQARARVG